MAFERLARRGIGAGTHRRDAGRAYISPVLTAHPTEVQRKSILDAERAIAELLAARDRRGRARARRQRGAAARPRHAALADAPAAHRQAHRRRRDRERAELLPRHLPARRSRASIATSRRRCRARRSRPSSAWATGSAATATATPTSTPTRLRAAFARQSETALRHYLTEVHELGAELSISATLLPVTPEMQRAGRRSPATPTRTARTSPTGAR